MAAPAWMPAIMLGKKPATAWNTDMMLSHQSAAISLCAERQARELLPAGSAHASSALCRVQQRHCGRAPVGAARAPGIAHPPLGPQAPVGEGPPCWGTTLAAATAAALLTAAHILWAADPAPADSSGRGSPLSMHTGQAAAAALPAGWSKAGPKKSVQLHGSQNGSEPT